METGNLDLSEDRGNVDVRDEGVLVGLVRIGDRWVENNDDGLLG